MRLKIFCDGGARGNPGPAAGAFVIKDEAGNVLKTGSKYLGVATNNEAEYWAVIEALGAILELARDGHNLEMVPPSQARAPIDKIAGSSLRSHALKLEVFLDSQLVVGQLSGRFKMKNARLRQLLFKIRELESQIGNISYQYIMREQNMEADKLVNEELDKQ